MLLTATITHKTIGNKELFKELKFMVEEKEKIAIIGRNGVGKTTLFRLLTAEDTDFSGDIQFKRGIRVVHTAQEHHNLHDISAIDYILQNLPDYKRLKHIIDTYPATMGDDMHKIQTYTNALEHFSTLGYFTIETAVLLSLDAYQISESMAYSPMRNLSGGQKRFVELVRIEHADADVALIDEPTNHMDYIAKEAFIDWLRAVKHAVVLISHDRDVLQHVDKIIELKDGTARNFIGNYDAYLKQNALRTTTQMHDYEIGNKTLENLHKQILWARARKPGWHGKGEKNPYDVMERRLQKQYDTIKDNLQKPSFWIDRESANLISKKASDSYQKYKAKNIRIQKNNQTEATRELLRVEDIQLSYAQQALFKPVSFSLQHGDRLQLVGRNGAGKSTLLRAIIDAANNNRAATWRGGSIFTDKKLRFSIYEQEVQADLLTQTLAEAIELIYRQLGLAVSQETTMRLMGDYLFNPYEDGKLLVSQLSGGQKARLQIIKMLANNPNLLILDEPTNHLDLPSIEELENALSSYHGALLYVSHDSYFAKNIGGDSVTLTPTTLL